MNEEKLREAFRVCLGLTAEQVTGELASYQVKEWDSIGHMALVAELEKVFDLELSVDDITDMVSMTQARAVLTRHGVAFP
jgi:acyl carrier protein